MPSFWKVDVQGRASQQEIHNILYYVDQATLGATFDVARMGDLATAVVAKWVATMLPNLNNAYVGESCTVSVINELQEVTSPYEVEIGFSNVGGRPGESLSPGSVYIVAFRTTYLLGGQTARTPKRGYVAVGPASETDVNSNGLVLLSTFAKEQIEETLNQNLTGGLGTYVPVRVGRPNIAGRPSYGLVVDAFVRDYMSFRRSRLIGPAGS